MDLLVLGRECLTAIEYIVRDFHRQNIVGGYKKVSFFSKKLLLWYQCFDKARAEIPDEGLSQPGRVEGSMEMLLKAMEDKDYIMISDLLEMDMKPLLYQIQAALLTDPAIITDFALFCRNVWMLKSVKPELLHTLGIQKTDAEGLRRQYQSMVSQYVDTGILEPASGGYATFAFESEGRRFYAHSNVNPMWEAIEQAGQYYDFDRDEYLLAGMGLGYLPAALLEVDGGITLTIYEWNKDVLRMAMLVNDLSWMGYENVRVIFDEEGTAFADCLSENTVPVLHYPTLQAMADKKRKMQLEQLFISDINVREYRYVFRTNFRENIKNLTESADVLGSRFEGRNAIIVSAGPSLANNIELLRHAPEGTLMIATGTVFKRLLGIGVKPDFVVFLDQNETLYAQVEGILDEAVPILVAGTAYKRVAKDYKGPKYLICQRENQLTTRLAEDRGYTIFESGGNVSILALDVCLRLGCQEIAFVGLDMAFTNGQTHEKGIGRDDTFAQGNLLPVAGVLGDEVYASKTFHIYRQRIEAKIAGLPPYKVIDATEGGAVKKGMQIMSLEDVLKRWR